MRFEAGVISRVRGHKTVAYARSGVAPDIGSAPRRNWLGKKSISVQIVGNEKVGGVNQLHQDFAISAEELLDFLLKQHFPNYLPLREPRGNHPESP